MNDEIMFPHSVELLNKAIDNEIATSLQYIYFHVHCEDQGYRAMAKYFRMTAIEEMQHIEMLSERILFLQGEVNMNTSFKTKQLTDVSEMMSLAMKLEQQTVDNYNQWAKECAELKDSTSHRLFQDLVAIEENHFDEFRRQTDNMKLYGIEFLMLDSYKNLKHTVKKGGEE